MKEIYELPFWEKGLLVAGVDEAGRGPLAGPLVACAVILPPYTEPFLKGDSKKLSPSEREEAYRIIKERALSIGTAVVDSEVIDRINILQATRLAMKRALEDLKHPYDVVITDWVKLDVDNCIAIPKGDERSLCCACASVVAKVLRDKIMEHYHRLYPQYDFASHKGYPTKEHLQRLLQYRESPIHRKSFRPVKALFSEYTPSP
ncbi:Ribonuclease H [Thermocrinis albus DSM 14484]|uniref:Ribonuclease HII n=1 Tax=Thermocrinis albus (strain DSM 14484 / JCM 11386 / HI 11/12) TaxID=638303 RepID=D3SPB3_THEAH|nr:ribonuclease HII [Thermocrinis albus]ADC89000.1 Ribonuclease H [Thermocrinis albus DSM 14484]